MKQLLTKYGLVIAAVSAGLVTVALMSVLGGGNTSDPQASNEEGDPVEQAGDPDTAAQSELSGELEAEGMSGSGEDFAVGLQEPLDPPESLLDDYSNIPQSGRPLEYADRLLLGGNYYGAAIKYERRLYEGDAGVGLSLRLGLAHEMTGNLSDAISYYSDAVRYSEINSLPQLWALVGMARSWIKSRKYDDADSLLSEMMLRFGSEAYPNEFRASVALLLAECVRLRNQSDLEGEQLVVPVYYQPKPNPDVYLQADEAYRIEREPEKLPAGGITVVQMPGKNATSVVLDIDLESMQITQMLRGLSVETEIAINSSEAATNQLSGRWTAPQRRVLTMAEWLDHVLAPHNLTWRQEEEAIHITAFNEVIAANKSQYFISRRGRLLRDVQVNAQNKHLRCIALMHEGNDFLLQMDFAAAQEKYQAAKRLRPEGELAAVLSFNAGLLHLKANENEKSLEAFYNALDQSLDPTLRSQSYVYIARLELSTGGVAKAILASSRGVRIEAHVESRLQSAIVLAKAYLLDDKPHAANEILFKYSHLLERSEQGRLASVLASMARLQIVGSRGGVNDESDRLLRALTAISQADLTDFADALLVSRAFGHVGLNQKAQDVMEEALSRATQTHWQQAISLELAENALSHNNPEQAEKYVSYIGAANDSQEVFMVQARVGLQKKDAEQCVAACRRLLAYDLTEDQAKEVLTLLGKAYQLQGRDHAAALCFSGVVPDIGVEP